MEVLKCKCCGASIAVTTFKEIYTREYCGSVQTLSSNGSLNSSMVSARGFKVLKSGSYSEAARLFDTALILDPENCEAYLGKAMIELRVTERNPIHFAYKNITATKDFIYIKKYASIALRKEINTYIRAYNETLLQKRRLQMDKSPNVTTTPKYPVYTSRTNAFKVETISEIDPETKRYLSILAVVVVVVIVVVSIFCVKISEEERKSKSNYPYYYYSDVVETEDDFSKELVPYTIDLE